MRRDFSLLTITQVPISQSSAGYTTLAAPKTGPGAISTPVYLLRLQGTMTLGGTVGVYSSDDDAGTNEVAMIGDQPVGANGGPHAVREDDIAIAPVAPAGKYLLLKTATGLFKGYAVIAYLRDRG